MAKAKRVPDAIVSKLTSGQSRLSIILWTASRKPHTVIIPLLVLLLLLGLGLFGVLYGYRISMSAQQDEALITAQSSLSAIVQTIESSYGPLIAIRERILGNPSWPLFAAGWDRITARIFNDVGARLLALQVAPLGVISAVYPQSLLNMSLGVDLMSLYPAGVLEQISWGVLGLQGPFVSAQGDWTMLTSLPVFTPSDSKVDYGNVTSNGICSIPQCFANGTRYWGTIYAILLIKPLVASLTSLDSIRQQGWRLSVTRETVTELTPEQMFAFNFAYNKTLFQVNGKPINPVSVQAKLIKSYSPAETSLMLQLSLAPANGWGGNWWGGAIAAVVLASVLVSSLTFISLVSRAQEEFLLYSILPPKVVSVMRSGESFVAQNECTLVFADVCGFTSISSTWKPHEVAAFVSELSFLFERECSSNGLWKIDLIGDCLFAGHGILETEDPVSGAVSATKCALALLRGVEGIVTKDGTPVRLRIGIHSGECVTTVVGQEFPKLTVFGDHVNIASRMESTGRPMEVHISTVVANRLREAGLVENGLALECRGKVELKNRGEMETYWAREAIDPLLTCPRDGPSRSYAKKSGSLSLHEESIKSDGLQHVGIEITEKEPAKENDRRSGRISATLPHTFNTGDHSKTSNSFWGRSSLTSRNQPVLRAIVSEDDPASEGLSRVFSQVSPHSLAPSDFDKRQKSMPIATPVMRIG